MRKAIHHTFIFLIFSLFTACSNGQKSDYFVNDKRNKTEMKQHKYTNNLINETSPYLLQHAHNPVNWHPWGEEALKKAKSENKLLLISIGYAACHWCHVMEKESFENEEIARIMNEYFVCIKVDREERPDVDQIYMNAVQLITGSGGWPLNCFALPDGRPFYGGTYFRPEQWKEILFKIHRSYEKEPEKVNEYAENLKRGIADSEIIKVKKANSSFKMEELKSGYLNWTKHFDKIYGGNSRTPKFPLPNSYQFLLQYYFYTQDKDALKHLLLTLDKMHDGGIYDHLGGGFARYSVDGFWKVPHFEKMLYDNGQLISLYAQAYQLTRDESYKNVVEETIKFVTRELMSQEFAFYSSLDADSDGEEGKFYVWAQDEINNLLDKKQAQIFNEYYSVKAEGNWEHTNILHRTKSVDKILEKYNLNQDEFENVITGSKKKLLKERSKRVRPGLDDKVLTSWNAIMLKALVNAYAVFNEKNYLELAIKNASFIEDKLIKEDYRLDRNYKNGKSTINAFLDDYALTADALIALYQITFDVKWLNLAKSLADYSIKHFYDKSSGMFFYTSELGQELIARKMELSDNVIPASNSVMARVLFMLGKYYYEENYSEIAIQMLSNVKENIAANIPYYSNWAMLMLSVINKPYEVVIVGKDIKKIKQEFNTKYLPNTLFAGSTNESNFELLKNRYVKGKTLIYVCKENVCKQPVETVQEALVQMNISK